MLVNFATILAWIAYVTAVVANPIDTSNLKDMSIRVSNHILIIALIASLSW
jgi:hypothetical protein